MGKYPDLTIRREDPTTVDPTAIADIVVSQTRLGGEIRYTR